MNSRQWLIVSCWGMAGFVIALAFKLEFRLAWLCALVTAWAVGTIIVRKDDRQFIAEFTEASPDDQKQILLKLGWEAKPFIHKVNGSYRYDQKWIFVNLTSCGFLVFGLTLVYSLIIEHNLSWDSNVTFVNMVLLFVGLICWVFFRRWRLRRYSCPKCKIKLYPLPNKKLHFECDKCKTLWYLMDVNEWC